MNHSKIASISYFLFFTAAFSFMLLALALICGIGNGPLIFPTAMVGAFALIVRINGWRKAVMAGAWGLVIIALSVVISGILCDGSYDGNFYHQETVALLAQGWNPYDMADLQMTETLWVRHYAIGIEMIASTIVTLTGSLEAGKAANLILTVSALGMVYAFLRRISTVKKRTTILASVAIIGSPVVICQMTTYYIDWTKYIFDVILLLSIYGLAKRWNKLDALTAAAVIVLAVATKFNVWFEACLIIALACVWFAATRQWRTAFKLAGLGLASVIVGAALCYHPYYHNYLIGGHIFYPLMGDNPDDIMTENTPTIFCHGRIVDFFRSMLSVSLPSADEREGGFGPLMAPMLIVSGWIVLKLRRSVNPAWIYALTATLLSCFIFEQSWWARYICQLWLVPAIALALALTDNSLRWLRNVLLAMMLVTAAVSIAFTGYLTARITIYRHHLYETARESSPTLCVGVLPQTIMHLRQHGIECKNIPATEIPEAYRSVKFYYHKTSYEPAILLDSVAYNRFMDELHNGSIFKYTEIQ